MRDLLRSSFHACYWHKAYMPFTFQFEQDQRKEVRSSVNLAQARSGEIKFTMLE